ncbi:hypothetical protein [Clostridium sp.]
MVASLAKSWIEITFYLLEGVRKSVASLAEAWIEIGKSGGKSVGRRGRLPLGGVD